MGFKPGTPKPANSGRKRGTANKKTILRVTDFVANNDIEIAAKIWEAIEAIETPVERAKALLALYKFIEPEAKEPLGSDDEEPDSSLDIISIVTRDGA